ncbi:MAG: putative DNA binding domain-containing protein [Ruminococcus sp.]|nr:putative DNA binding domain-containing protein [Ruminococcus sp.]
MKLSDFIGETTEYDKKEMLEERKPKSWLKSVSAFANGIGGALIFGVSDDETLVGLDDAKDASEKISEAIKTKMDPIPDIVLKIHKEDGKEFVVLDVKSGMETPYYYIGDGGHIAFVRVGNESIPADAIALKRLVMKGSNITFDSISTRYNFNGFAFTKLRSVYRQRTKKELSESDFASFGLVDEDGMLTNAGALLADESPIRHSRLFCTRWYGLDKASGIMEALDDREVSGSLITLLQAGEEFVNNNTKKRWKKTGNGRIEMPEYPERAVLECIVNALIHRDYLILGSEVHIDIFDDRIEITSPGGMPDGSAVQNLDTDNVISKRRNPVIADVFSRMNYMERRGSGFKKIKDDYHFAVNYRPELEPKFYSDISTFKVTLYNLNYNVPVEKVGVSDEKQAFDEEKTDLQDKKQVFEELLLAFDFTTPTKSNILKVFTQVGTETAFARADVMEFTGLTATPATELMRKMRANNLIKATAKRGKYKFVIPKE